MAATLVATIDPFEQIKKANDTKVQNAAVEFETAIVRYYTSQNGFPWWVNTTSPARTCKTEAGTTGAGTSGSPYIIDAATPKLLNAVQDCILTLSDLGELKPSFVNVTGVLDKITLSTDATGLRPVVCYQPTSKSGKADKAAIYVDNIGTVDVETINTPTACLSRGGAVATCYWCTQ